MMKNSYSISLLHRTMDFARKLLIYKILWRCMEREGLEPSTPAL